VVEIKAHTQRKTGQGQAMRVRTVAMAVKALLLPLVGLLLALLQLGTRLDSIFLASKSAGAEIQKRGKKGLAVLSRHSAVCRGVFLCRVEVCMHGERRAPEAVVA